MQALSIRPSIIDFWPVPQLSMEVSQVGSSCTTSTGIWRTKGWDFVVPSCDFSSSRAITIGACLGRSLQYELGHKIFSAYNKFRVCGFCEQKEGSFRAPVSLAWTVEGQALIPNELFEEDSGSVDGVSRENVLPPNVSEGENNNVLVLDKNINEDPQQSEEKKGKNGRVDVRWLAWSLRFARTAEDVEEVLKDKGELSMQVYSSMIRGFGVDKRLDSAMALVQWLKEKKKDTKGFVGPNRFVYNSLLGAVKQSERFGEAEKIVRDMVAEGVLPNAVTYNTLMSIYIEQGREAQALYILEYMQRKGVYPSSASYSMALLAYRRLEDGFGALKLYVELKEKYQNGSLGKDAGKDWGHEFAKLENFTVRICYQVMRRWLVKSDNFSSKVLDLLADMDKIGLETIRGDCGKLLWACTREEHYMVAKELYKRIRERDSEISLLVCNHVIWLMGMAKKWWAALEIYEDLLDKGPEPDNLSYELIVSHFNFLLSAARRKGFWRWGLRILNKMKEKGLKPGSKEWNAVLVACSKSSETNAAVHIFKMMLEQGEKPTITSYAALLSALEKGKLYDEVQRVWEHMKKVGVEPDLYAYTIMASTYAAQGKFNFVDSIILEMVSSGIGPTTVTFNAIISRCAQANISGSAYEWFQKMKAQDISPDEVTYEVLIKALIKDGKPKLAYDLYLRARMECLNLSSRAYDAVIQSSQNCGATIDASVIGPRLQEKKKKLQTRKKLSEFSSLADVPLRSKPFEYKEIRPQTEGNL